MDTIHYREVRTNGTPRIVIFSRRAIQRIKERLPESHKMREIGVAQLADVIELAIIGALDQGLMRPIVSPKHGTQLHVDIQRWVGYPLLIVIKDTGANGASLDDRKIAVTALVATDRYRKTIKAA